MGLSEEFLRMREEYTTPLRLLGETFNRHRLDEFRLLQETIDRSISEPIREFQRVMSEESARMKELYNDNIIESARQAERNLREMQEAMNLNFRNLIDDSYLESQRQIQKTLRSLIRPSREIQKTLSEFFGSHQMQQKLEDFSTQMNRVSHGIDMGLLNESIKIKEALSDNLAAILKIPFRSRELFKEFDELTSNNYDDEFIVSSDGTITLGSETIPADQVKESITEFLDSLGFPDADNFLEKLRDLKKPVRKYVLFAILTILLNLLSAYIYDTYVSSNYEKKSVIKDMKKAFVTQDEIDSLSNYRTVIASALNVRTKPSRNSGIVGKIYLGKVVKVLKRKKDWTLIEMSSQDSEILIRGWVFTRYLDKISL